MATANSSAAGATPARRDLQSIPLRGHTVYVWRSPEPTKHAFAWRVVMDTDQREEVAAGEADTAADAWDAALAQVPDADQADFTEEQGEALFSQVMACEPLLAVEDVDRFLNAMHGPDARRELRAIAAFATKDGEFYKQVSEDRETAVAMAMVAMLARVPGVNYRERSTSTILSGAVGG